MRGQLHGLATIAAAVAVIQPAVLAQGTSPWVDAVANLSTAFTGPITLPGGKNQPGATPSGAARVCDSCRTDCPKIAILRGSLLARSPYIVRHARFRKSAKYKGGSGLQL